jgi:hypothetical protein
MYFGRGFAWLARSSVSTLSSVSGFVVESISIFDDSSTHWNFRREENVHDPMHATPQSGDRSTSSKTASKLFAEVELSYRTFV